VIAGVCARIYWLGNPDRSQKLTNLPLDELIIISITRVVMEGHCLCGAITVKIHDAELFLGKRRGHMCHCRNCRRIAGGIFGSNLAIEADKVEIIGSENLAAYLDTDTSSGVPMSRRFCRNCGT
jgi:hypothetical protein